MAASGRRRAPSSRERILGAVRAEPPQVVVPLEPRRRRAGPVLGAITAVAAAVAVGVGLWAADLSLELDDTRAALERERAAAAVLADPGARSTALQEGEGRLIVAEDSRAVLVLDALEPAPSGKTYQVWIVDQGEAPAGLFPGSEGVEIVQVEGTVEPGEVVAVTIEDAGGAEAPSSEPIVGSMPV